MKKTTLMRRVEKEHGAPVETLLAGLVEQGCSYEQIARRLDISYWTIRNWVARIEAPAANRP